MVYERRTRRHGQVGQWVRTAVLFYWLPFYLLWFCINTENREAFAVKKIDNIGWVGKWWYLTAKANILFKIEDIKTF